MDPSMMGEGGGGGAGLILPGSGSANKLASQSLMAVQEFGMVIGVAFLVGVLFMLLIYTEKAWAATSDRLHDYCGRKPKDEEDPAALVGTFKRYKNWSEIDWLCLYVSYWVKFLQWQVVVFVRHITVKRDWRVKANRAFTKESKRLEKIWISANVRTF